MHSNTKNISLTEDQQKYVRLNYQDITIRDMANELNIGYSKLYNNMALMKLYKKDPKPAFSIPVTRRGFFDVDRYLRMALI